MWRDIFPEAVMREISGSRAGHSCFFDFQPGDILPPYDAKKVYPTSLQNFSFPAQSADMSPAFGRFYPQGFLKGIAGIYPQSTAPMRVIAITDTEATFDCNHPMAGKTFSVEMQVAEITTTSAERGGRCSDWLDCALDKGPGMQARWNNQPTDFEISDPLPRPDDGDDMQFYSRPRLVHHVDSRAGSFIRLEYEQVLRPGDTVLDLMSSLHSHHPPRADISVVGLGLNSEEMELNKTLSSHILHDLNAHPQLPFADGEFSVVLCSLSVEYLIHPQAVINEATRVLCPGGTIMISFSNRWFPPKVTTLWPRLHEFERMGFVLELLMNSNCLTDYTTVSYRNWPRPPEDKYASTIPLSDPIYLVKAVKNNG